MSCRRLPGQAARDVNVNRSRTPESTSTQAILAKAFRGELVPTEAEVARAEGRDYETAAQLLARIRAEVTIDETNRETKSYRYTRSSLSTCRRSPHSTTASSHGTSVDDGSASNSRKSSRRPASVCPARRTTGTKPPVYRAAPRSKKHAHRKGCPPTYYGFHDLLAGLRHAQRGSADNPRPAGLDAAQKLHHNTAVHQHGQAIERGRGSDRGTRCSATGEVGLSPDTELSAACFCCDSFFAKQKTQPVDWLRLTSSGQGRDRTGDTGIFSPVLYQLSYLSPASLGDAET